MKLRKAPIAFAASLAAASTLWIGGAASAKALDESCGSTGCSSSVNDSAYSATALFNWCGGGTTGTLTTTRPTCGNQKSMGLVPGGGHTPWNEDWDTLQIDGGWCYKVKFTLPAQPDNVTRYDRRGKSAAWVKVEDFSDAHVLAQSTSSCPA
jgi:hypothetical protein